MNMQTQPVLSMADVGRKIRKTMFVFIILISIASALMVLWRVTLLGIYPGTTFLEASKEGQECTIDLMAYSGPVGNNESIKGMSFYLLQDEDGSVYFAYMEDSIYEQCCEKNDEIIPLVGYSKALDNDVAKLAAKVANIVFEDSGYYSANNITELFGDYYFIIGEKAKSRTYFWMEVMVVIAIASLGGIFLAIKYKRPLKTSVDNISKSRKKAIVALSLATLASIGYLIGWVKIGLLYFASTANVSTKEENPVKAKRFVFWSTTIFFVVGVTFEQLLFYYINMMTKQFYICAIPFLSTVPMFFSDKRNLISTFVPMGVALLFMAYAVSVSYAADNEHISTMAHLTTDIEAGETENDDANPEEN